MTTADLQKKIAEVLGVSVSEKELAFEILISKVCDILTDEVTLKVQRIGFFQLKKGFTRATAESILFIPLSEELYRDSKNLFLTIPIHARQDVEEALDSDVFSIGVGKPILPLSENEPQNTETSYAILRKSIEERVVEILSEADQLPNFNIWEDYYKSVKYVEHEEEKDALSELTADLDFKEEFMAEDLTKNLLELSSGLDVQETKEENDESREISLYDLLGDYQVEPGPTELKSVFDLQDDKNDSPGDIDELEKNLLSVIEEVEGTFEQSDNTDPVPITENQENEEVVISSAEVNDFSEVENIISDLTTTDEDDGQKETDEIFPEQSVPNFDEIENIIGGLTNTSEAEKQEEAENDEIVDADKTEESDLLEIEVPTQTKEILFEIKRESMLEDVDLEAAKENDDVEPVYYLGLKNKEGESVEWDWGDELKEEFGVEFLKEELEKQKLEEDNDGFEDEPDTLEQIIKRSKTKKPTLFDELDNSIKNEFTEPESHQILEFSGQPPRYQFIEDRSTSSNHKTNYDTLNETTEENMEGSDKGFSFGRIFLIIFVSFVVVASLIIFLLTGEKNDDETTAAVKTETENYSLEQNNAQNTTDTTQIVADDFNDFPRVPVIPPGGAQANTTPVRQDIQPAQTTTAPAEDKKTASNNGLYKKLETDTRVGKTVYFDGKSYNYQMSSWRNKVKAEQEVRRLRGLGADAFLTEAFLPEKGGTWYRVRVGNYKTKEEAEQNSIKNNF